MSNATGTTSSSFLGRQTSVFIIWASMMAESVTEEPNRTLSNRWIEQEGDTSPLTEEVAVIWSNSTPFPGNETNGTNATLPFVFTPIVWSASKAGSFLASLLIMIGTVFGNALVLLSVYFEKKLQTPFNFYLVNLALTDLNVGLSVMTMFIIYNLYEYFPFDFNTCRYVFLFGNK